MGPLFSAPLPGLFGTMLPQGASLKSYRLDIPWQLALEVLGLKTKWACRKGSSRNERPTLVLACGSGLAVPKLGLHASVLFGDSAPCQIEI